MFMPKTDELRPLELKLLEVMQTESSEWLSRGQIAELLGRPDRIHPGDVAALEKLAAMGLIEARQTPRGVAGVKWEYRVETKK
jgi:hypothetical protein